MNGPILICSPRPGVSIPATSLHSPAAPAIISSMAKRRANIVLSRKPALLARRVLIAPQKLVYVLVADKKLHYDGGRSRIAYIGTTATGAGRVAQSVAHRAHDILAIRGVRSFEARILTTRGRQRVQMWRKLERAMLLEFRELFGEPPWCNIQGRRMRERDEFEYFARSRVRRIIDELS